MTLANGGGTSLKAIQRNQAPVYHLPGRDWFLCVGPENTDAKNITLGVAEFPAGSNPPGHIHPGEEEVVYIISGGGQLVTPEGTAELEPGADRVHPGRPPSCDRFPWTRALGSDLGLLASGGPRFV